ncbi:hypothetical protein BGX28_004099 [Mortierella sp. GBA30]|nr:hypothetical protein BGX28_004099 [Mortierella sp. GBA30]
MGIVVSLMRSSWALAYAATSFLTLVLTATAITGPATQSRSANLVLTLLNNPMSELPLTVIALDALFSIWLRITGTYHQSSLATFFYYVNMVTTIGLLFLFKQSLDAKNTVQVFLDKLAKESKRKVELTGWNAPRFWHQFLNPLYWPRGCEVFNNIPYWRQGEQLNALKSGGWKSVLEMSLDVYRPNGVEGGDDKPVLMYIHGGGWTGGSKSLTGPLLTEMVSRGWVVVSIDYRLTAKAGYPTQLIDCKRALRWVKDEIRIFGGDPNSVIVAGDSAGGHLAALIALTPNQPEYQPGFEGVDTSVQGCVAQSAAFDLIDFKNYSRYGFKKRFIKEVANRGDSAESPENLKFLKEHSPMFRISEVAVPFLVIHGDLDNMWPIQSTRDFVQEFRSKSKSPIDYAEVNGGHHCFHALSSPRTWYWTIATAEWLDMTFDRQDSAKKAGVKKVHELVEWGWTD